MSSVAEKLFEIRELIKERSPFDQEETSRIAEKFFKPPSSSVKMVLRDCRLDKKKVLDIGCSYGQSLLYWGPDSEGIEVSDKRVEFLRALGRTVHQLNVEEGFPGFMIGAYDAIYTDNLIEHLVSTHLFLVRLHSLLKPGGTLVIGHPVVPPRMLGSIWRLFGYRGWLAVQHVNFFTHQTARHTLERAGYVVEHQYFPRVASVSRTLSKIAAPIGVHVISICRRIDEFKYDPKKIDEGYPSWASDLLYFGK